MKVITVGGQAPTCLFGLQLLPRSVRLPGHQTLLSDTRACCWQVDLPSAHDGRLRCHWQPLGLQGALLPKLDSSFSRGLQKPAQMAPFLMQTACQRWLPRRGV